MFELNKKCELCGAQVTVAPNGLSARCEYCGHKYTYKIPVTENTANEIARKRFENLYQKAMRKVDTSSQRTKNAGLEYEAKAKEMYELGDYRNAASLALQYEEKVEFYLAAEKEEKQRKKKLDSYKIAVSLIAVVPGVITAVSAWQSSGNLSVRLLSIISMVFLFGISVAYAILNGADVLYLSQNETADFFLHRFERVLYCLNIVIWSVIFYLSVFVNNVEGNSVCPIFCILLTIIVIMLTYKQKTKDLPNNEYEELEK